MEDASIYFKEGTLIVDFNIPWDKEKYYRDVDYRIVDSILYVNGNRANFMRFRDGDWGYGTSVYNKEYLEKVKDEYIEEYLETRHWWNRPISTWFDGPIKETRRRIKEGWAELKNTGWEEKYESSTFTVIIKRGPDELED